MSVYSPDEDESSVDSSVGCLFCGQRHEPGFNFCSLINHTFLHLIVAGRQNVCQQISMEWS